jgi:rhodanese-related sulfurtransferase
MKNRYQEITFEQAHALQEQNPDCLILDVREENEYITGHATGAVLFPVDSINENSARAKIPSVDTPVLVYCRSGKRSQMAADKLSQLGYTQVYDLGSLVGWPYGMEW